MHHLLSSPSSTAPSGRGWIVLALSAFGLALTALLVLLPNRIAFAANVDIGVSQSSVPASPVVGSLLTYTIVVTNGPEATEAAVSFTNTLPANVILASVSTTQGTCNAASPVTCTLGPTLAASATVTVTIAVTPTLAGALSNVVEITVTTPPDTDTFADNNLSTLNLTANNPTPSISSLSPNSAAVGSGAFTLTVNGAGFVNGSVVRWNGSDRATTFVSTTQLTATVLAADVQAAGSFPVTVFSPTPGGGLSSSATFTVGRANPTVTISSDAPDPSVVGQAVTVNFTVAGAGVTPTGSVTVTVSGGSETCTGTLTAGAGSCSLTLTSAGARTLTASYGGDANYLASSDTELHSVNPANTTTTLTTSGTPSVFGQSVTFTAAVTVTAPGGGVPTGAVTFFVNGTPVLTPTLNGSGQAAYITSALAVASHTITATYNSSANYNASTAAPLTQVVNRASTTTTLATTGSPSVFGQSVTFTATVSAQAPGGGTPTGTVTFFVNGASVSTSALNGSGQATYVTSTLPVATHSITATYAGSGNYNASTSGTLTQIVNRAASTTTITSDLPDPSVVGETFPVTVTVSGAAGVAPTGLFTVTVAGGPWTCNALLANGTGRCDLTITTTTGSPRTLTANYGGDLNYNASSDNETHSINRANTTTSITSAVPPQPTLGQTLSVAYTVTVNSPGLGFPTGTVTITAGSDFCTGTVAAGNCTLTFTTPTGSRTLTAAYQGDSNFNSSTSSGIPINIVRPTVQFSAPTYSVQEDTGGGSPAAVSAIITATLSNPSIYTVTVDYATSNGSAVAGTDYQAAGGTLTFNPGQTQRPFIVTTIPDGLAEGDETVTLTLSNPNNRANLGAQSTSTLVIADNEGTPTLRLPQSAVTVAETMASLNVNVTLSTPAQNTVTVTVSSVNGTATAGQDFVAVNQVLAFAPQETLSTFSVTLLNDNIYELDEVFTLTLSNATNALISSFQQTQTVTIQSEEAPPSVQFSSPILAFAENAGAVTIAVTLSRPSALTAQVNYATSNGTAVAGVDYQSASGTLTFAPLDTSETILVPLIDDSVAEDYKNLFLTLRNPSVATPSGAGMNSTVTIANDDARAGCTIFQSSDVPRVIPDNLPTGITSTLTLPGPGFVITDVSVRIDSLQHGYLGALQISLVAPDSRVVSLLVNNGKFPNLVYTVFNDFGDSINGDEAPFTGVFQPNTTLPALRRLVGALSGGVWKLRIVDDATPDPGDNRLNAWGLELCGSTTMTHVVYLPLVRR